MAPLKHGYKVAGRVYQEVEEPNRQRNYRKGKAVMREGLSRMDLSLGLNFA